MRGALGRRLAGTPTAELRERSGSSTKLAVGAGRRPEAERACSGRDRLLRPGRIPFLDPSTCASATASKTPMPTSQAVMFCLMDVSGSMDRRARTWPSAFHPAVPVPDAALRKIDIVFIRHHTQAMEVDEDSSSTPPRAAAPWSPARLVLMQPDHQAERYPPGDWNIYVAQASDGDNWQQRQRHLPRLLADKIPAAGALLCLRAGGRGRAEPVGRIHPARLTAHFAMRKTATPAEIYPVFATCSARRGERMNIARTVLSTPSTDP